MEDAQDDLKQQRLAKVLLEFGRAPGKYPVRLGEPRELHKELDTLTVWALGRLPKELESDAGALRDAAVLFIARACFAPEATHYQMFGLTPGTCTPEALRGRYRNLIRLTHPDMGVKGLPANAAGAVNRAQGVLSDPDQRRRYDEELAERKANASSADRERATVRAQGVRRIEHKVTFAERWQSLKARFPNLARTGALAGGVAVVAIGLLVLALTSQNDERTLIAARSPDEAPNRIDDRKNSDSALASNAKPAADGRSPTAQPTAPGGAVPPSIQRGTASSVPSPSKTASTGSIPSPMVGSAPPPPVRSSAEASDQVLASASRAPANAGRERHAVDVVTDPQARLKSEATAAAGMDAGSSSRLEPSTLARPATAPAIAAPTPPALLPPETRRASAPRAETAAGPLPAADSAPSRATTTLGNPPPSPPPVVVIATAPAPAPASIPLQAPTRFVAAAPSPSSTPQATASAAMANAKPASAGGQVWKVDTTGAMQYLSELISVLETPKAAFRTNAYLTEMKVKGSLFRPALRMMQDFSEIDVSRLDWSDSQTPGVLKVRGTLVLQAKSSQPPFNRTANFRLTAEFWGTANGTVLAELNLREAE